jgi:hypothetical protein
MSTVHNWPAAWPPEFWPSALTKRQPRQRRQHSSPWSFGDAHLEMTLGYEGPDFKARFKKQIEEAIEASLC